MNARICIAVLTLASTALACGSSADTAAPPTLQIVTASGAPLHAVAGDDLPLEVVLVSADGTTAPLPESASVIWTVPAVVTTLPPGDDTDPSPLPVPGSEPTIAWIDNPSRPDRQNDLANVLFVLDPGTVQNASVQVTAVVTGAQPSGPLAATTDVTASIDVDPTPAGDWTRGATLYGAGGANCAQCHGPTGHGSDGAPEAATYAIAGNTYDFPAPGINAEPGNAAGDPAWNAALFAVAARADMDNGGVALRVPMPDWIANTTATGQYLSTQDFADIFAFLKTETH